VDREGGGHRGSVTAAGFVLSGGGGDLFGQLGHGKSSSDTMTKLLREPYLDLVRVACYIGHRVYKVCIRYTKGYGI
jgi:hypothetical protein